jgi:hypothetical protein
MVNGDGLARRGRHLCQLAVTRQHVDERRFSHVGTPDESVFRLVGLRELFDVGVALQKSGRFDYHDEIFLQK